jgi:hypothetical protein
VAESSSQSRFKHLPPPVDPATLRASQDVDPHPPEDDDTYRELLWVVNRYG